MPMVWVSMMERNSLRTGSGASTEMIRRQSPSGNPALMPRTITSTESAKPLRNFCSRRFLRKDRIHRGKPKLPAKPAPMAAGNPNPAANIAPNDATPSNPLTMKNWRFDRLRPARDMRTESGGELTFLRRTSTSLRVSSSCSRRLRVAPRAAGAALVAASGRTALAFR